MTRVTLTVHVRWLSVCSVVMGGSLTCYTMPRRCWPARAEPKLAGRARWWRGWLGAGPASCAARDPAWHACRTALCVWLAGPKG